LIFFNFHFNRGEITFITPSVVLQEDQNQLDEIVVTGYGTRKRSQITGAVAKIGGSDIGESTKYD
jgi:hypothetical protein